MIQPAFEILNQRGTPMFFSDVFANRPTAGVVGRIFISTDTYAFYRDTGTGWDLIGGPGTGTITGSGAVSQVAFWNGSSTITGENNLWWDSTNNHFGINTNTPGTAADIHHDQSTIMQLNQTTATNDTRIAFQNSGTALWRIGNFYTAGANDWGIYDVVGAIQPLTIVKTTGQTFIGSKTTASGRLVVNNASSDAHIQVVGANSPSIRIDNAGTGATRRFVMGLATATNNFIQGSTAGDICISTASASPLLFGMWQTINASEVMRISTSNNLLIGRTTDAGYKLDVNGTANFSSTLTIGPLGLSVAGLQISGNDQANTRIKITNTLGSSFSIVTGNPGASNNGFAIYDEGAAATRLYFFTTGAATFSGKLGINGGSSGAFHSLGISGNTMSTDDAQIGWLTSFGNAPTNYIDGSQANNRIRFITNNSIRAIFDSSGNLGLNSTPSAWTVFKAFQVGNRTSLASEGTVTDLNLNVYYDGNYRYIENSNATQYRQQSGQHQWFTASSGTAGNIISFTQAMTLYQNGNLLIGTTTDAGYKLQVAGSFYVDEGTNGNTSAILASGTVSGRVQISKNANYYIEGGSWYGYMRYNSATYHQMNQRIEILGSIKTSNPNTGTAAEWKLGSRVAAAVVLNTTQYIEIDIAGTLYKLATIT